MGITKKPVKYAVIDAFTDSEFKGNPAAVCLLEEERENEWLQSVAAEFNISETSYLIPFPVSDSPHPRFHLRWFTPVTEVVLPSAKAVTDMRVDLEEVKKCPGRGLIISAAAPSGSEFDFFSRFFCPKYGIDEDPVCGSAHCALAWYWSKKMGKSDFTAFAASPRSGILKLQLDEQKNRVKLRGKAVTVMEGSVIV
ncbi:hypothetical protein SOVF_008630 isoform A [Spinacia oleracea]|nr:hypothetical protein SOVF_008630 isoform A [Spinacia oleracea]